MNGTQTLNLTQKDMRKELRLLRSFVIGMAGRDAEGSYRPEFVQRILKVVNEQPTNTFKDSGSFLSSLEKHSK